MCHKISDEELIMHDKTILNTRNPIMCQACSCFVKHSTIPKKDNDILTLQHGVTSAARHSENITSWNDEHCLSHYALSLIGQYLDKIVSKCNRAASCVFMKVLALLWYGRQFLEIISSFLSLLLKSGFSFCNLYCP
jgi:hypothetical protein